MKSSFSLFLVALSFIVPCACVDSTPTSSTRNLLYLHTTPASWGSARDTCARYGTHLVNIENIEKLEADILVLDKYLQWGNSFSKLNTNIWSGLYNSTIDHELYWHGCQPFDHNNFVFIDVADQLHSDTLCASMDKELIMSATSCDTRLPYICHAEKGECWFLPVSDMVIDEDVPDFHATLDLSQCAQRCRELNDTAAGKECWGFTYNQTTNDCKAYMSSVHYAYLRDISNSLRNAAGSAAYLKICAGGEVTSLDPFTVNASMVANCSAKGYVANGWDESVCYCDCDQPLAVLEPSELVLTVDEKIDNLVHDLIIDPLDTSSAQRKLNSAEDNRASATSIGSLGITILTFVFGTVVLVDVFTLYTHIARVLIRRSKTLYSESDEKIDERSQDSDNEEHDSGSEIEKEME